MKAILVIIFFVAFIRRDCGTVAAESNGHGNVAPVPVMVANNGYAVETHRVTTTDGYILTMHRIPASPSSPASQRKPIVFLMHGLLCSSADWVVMGPGESLAYILADAGYDVWIGNARGNTYSRNHTTITDLKGEAFWDFSWHEIGVYDLPAMIDFALQARGQNQLIYIGHSQGTTSFYVMGSERPEYNAKIKAMFSLAPVAYMGHMKSPLLRLISLGVTPLSQMSKLLGFYEFLPSSELLRSAGETFCSDDDFTQPLCSNALFILCGFNKAQLNTTTLPAIMEHTPAGASTKQILHYGQGVISHEFRQFNRRLLNVIRPPKYNLRFITAPVHLIYGDNDWLAAVQDVTQLYNELGNPIEMLRVLDGKWNHLDSLYGIDAKTLVYDGILSTIEKRGFPIIVINKNMIVLNFNTMTYTFKSFYETLLSEKRVLHPMIWGMIPRWHKSDYKKHGMSTHNARCEGLSTSKLYSQPLTIGQRCVILCDGYYEWKTTGKVSKGPKQPYFIHAKQDEGFKIEERRAWENNWSDNEGWRGIKLLKLAGIFDSWLSAEGKKIYSCTMITKNANDVLSWLHHRVPVFLDSDEEVDDWLDYKNIPSTDAVEKSHGPTKDALTWHPVDPMVNDSLFKSATCYLPIVLEEKKAEGAQSGLMASWLKTGSMKPAAKRKSIEIDETKIGSDVKRSKPE